jgi:hypothetical protein
MCAGRKSEGVRLPQGLGYALGRMRRRSLSPFPRTLGLVALALAGLAAAASCASFGAEPPQEASPAEAGSDGALPAEASTDGGLDATSDGAGPRGACPPPAGGATAPTSWARRTIFASDAGVGRSYPFAIAPDATHVTWVAQLGLLDGGPDTEPYNGHGTAVVLRAPKAGGGPFAVLARDQARAMALAVDGDFAYWGAGAAGAPEGLFQQRTSVDCGAGACAVPPVKIATFPDGVEITRLRRAGPGLLVALAGDGRTFRIAVGSDPVELFKTGTYPAVALTDTHVYGSAAALPSVVRAELSSGAVSAPYVGLSPVDGGDLGGALLATDCSALWMVRKQPGAWSLQRHDLGAATPFVPVASLAAGPFDLAADARHVFAAVPNGGGVYAYELSGAATSVSVLYAGNVFALAVDDDGVYFGEHDQVRVTAGEISMLVTK